MESTRKVTVSKGPGVHELYAAISTYRGNYKKLVAVKKKDDKENLFRVNQNIKP